MGYGRGVQVFIMILTLLPLNSEAWGWFGSSDRGTPSGDSPDTNGMVAVFSMEQGLNNPKVAEMMENAQRKLMTPNSCWQNAYRNLFDGCSKILAAEEKRSRFAWHLSDCFQRDSGRSPFPHCDERSSTTDCRKKLDQSEGMVFLEFYLETNSICHQLQANAFKQETERLVNDLKTSAEYAEGKLDGILERSDSLSRSSKELQDSLASIDLRTLQLSKASKNVEEHVATIWNHAQALYEQSQGIAATQSELQEGQSRMNEQLEEEMTKISDSYSRLGRGIENLRIEALDIENEIAKLRDNMFSKMDTLQGKADDIGNMAGASLEKQRQLLEGQSNALEGLQFLTEFQSKALAESRSTLQRLTEYSSSQQQQLLKGQNEIHQVHDRLVEKSNSILAAQVDFESKQATMFAALDKLFALHNAMLLESRLIKAFFMYSLSIFIIYMFTSTKQTYNVRPWLYIVLVLRFTRLDIEQQAKILTFFRYLFAFLAAAQLLHAIFTHRDYEVLNHQILLNLMEKVNYMQSEDKLSWETDSDVDWSSWIDSELPDEVESSEDPNYEVSTDVGESSLTTYVRKEYNLRKRLHG
ncbi:protein GAMETE EXPRESSED 1 isoform X2 [Punica granatum]|uniref:Protein GAMETE EXPRESSED 1 isoform X2 n=1 Tax=Punica granatum TaxID=22663 RepID=A0A6P8EEU3_PUNGR|nr:protein GAMETE EXPRESSED 1 isoform X2 [Punica granatum]